MSTVEAADDWSQLASYGCLSCPAAGWEEGAQLAEVAVPSAGANYGSSSASLDFDAYDYPWFDSDSDFDEVMEDA